MWEKRISHDGLGAYRVVKGQTQYDVEMKAAAQEAVWKSRWEARRRVEQGRQVRASRLAARAQTSQETAAAKAIALEQTRELEQEREELQELLKHSLAGDPALNWDSLKDSSKFDHIKPTSPAVEVIPIEIDPGDRYFKVEVAPVAYDFFDLLIPSRKRKKMQAADEALIAAREKASSLLAAARREWNEQKERVEQQNASNEAFYQEALKAWTASKLGFLAKQHAQHVEVDQAEQAYKRKEEAAVANYIEDVLSRSEYPDSFPKEHNFSLDISSGVLILDYEMPSRDALPTVKEVKFVASRSEYQEVLLPETWFKKVYEDVLYQIALRTLSELFRSDVVDALVSVVLNGWVRSIDRATGSHVHSCVLTIDVRKDEFLALNLDQVDYKACFKKLKGVSASKLIELAPVKPLGSLNKTDQRFVDGYSVVEGIDERTNLAAMDWLDFENLIREVFEKEFSKGGGEVKITQASRDGGVDAVAFDPDPIRGGKIVIQAKRYTNTVGVSAVRDLYGTVHNEGANKGILVTTSDFGPDAYAFAKDKPLTLLSGAELLYLLGQHGHQAKIDLAEAKRIAAEIV